MKNSKSNCRYKRLALKISLVSIMLLLIILLVKLPGPNLSGKVDLSGKRVIEIIENKFLRNIKNQKSVGQRKFFSASSSEVQWQYIIRLNLNTMKTINYTRKFGNSFRLFEW